MSIKKIKTETFCDDRGTIFFPFRTASVHRALKGTDLKQCHIATMKPGAVRGNHYHPDHDEYILVVGTGGTLVTTKGKAVPIGDDLVKIARNTVHAIVNRGKREIVLVCFYRSRGNKKLVAVKEKVV